MFTELPKLLGRDFVIGYVLPSIVLLSGIVGVMYMLDAHPQVVERALNGDLVILGWFAFFVYIVAILALTLNTRAIRLLEGYWPDNIRKLFVRREQARFDDLMSRIENATDPGEIGGLLYRAATEFPDTKGLVLPTRFGNSIRAFEVYPRVVYGFEAVGGWERLLAVMPKEYREQIDNSKAMMDLWVNLGYACILVFIFYIGCAFSTWRFCYWWIPVAAIVGSWVCIYLARFAAMEWGTMVRSGVDLFLPELGRKLGFAIPQSTEERIRFWNEVSRSFIHRQPVEWPPAETSSPTSCSSTPRDPASNSKG
jgi:hypothetical protein